MSEPHCPTLVIVGGFLGSGKTTLILKAAELLARRGKKPAAILNDQDAGLVDTHLALAHDLPAREVADGCICCRFSEFLAAASTLAKHDPDVIFAEPVGSCTDLSATVIRPLQQLSGDRLRIAPLTVLLDPATAEDRLAGRIDPDMAYLTREQLVEADLICTTRQDLYPHKPELSFPVDFHLSGKTGYGVEDWLRQILEPTRVAGARLLEIDYDRYAEAEAALGWLNLHAELNFDRATSPAVVCGPLLDRIEDELSRAEIALAHLKVFDRTETGWLKASICSNGSEPVPEGDLLAEPSEQHELALNLRAGGRPERLQQIVSSAIEQIGGRVHIKHFRSFSPPRPMPEHRVQVPRIADSDV